MISITLVLEICQNSFEIDMVTLQKKNK